MADIKPALRLELLVRFVLWVLVGGFTRNVKIISGELSMVIMLELP